MKYYVSLMLLFIPLAASANLNDEMRDLFGKMGTAQNYTRPDAYRGQEGYFMYGGNAFLRGSNKSVQPAWYHPPGWRLGDCDMDLWAGGFGFIDSKQFVAMARNIGSNATAYLFTTALKQITPQIANQMESLQNMANQINQFNINSCEAGKFLVDSSMDVIRNSANRACQTHSLHAGHVKGPIDARAECNKDNVARDRTKEAANNKALEAQLPVDKNFAWHAINNNPSLKGLDNNTKYFLMTLTGTIVVTDTGSDSPVETMYISKLDAEPEALLDSFYRATEMELYTCANNSDNKCLDVKLQKVKISDGETIYRQIENVLKSIEAKVLDDEALTEKEKAFIANTNKPIYKLIKMQTVHSRGVQLSFIDEYVELMALDAVYQYMDKCISDVRAAFANNHLPGKYNDKFLNMMMDARRQLRVAQNKSSQMLFQNREMVMRVETLQRQLSSVVSSDLFDKMAFSRNVRK